MQGNYDGHISNFGETVDLVAADGSTVSTVTTPSIPSDNQQYLRISEIMYHPADPTPEELAAGYDDGDLFEFIELYNTSASTSLNLAGVRFTNGISFTFGDVVLPPSGVVVLVSNTGAFAERYGAIAVAGQYDGNLSNGGEGLKLEDADGSTIHEFAYDDNGDGWHPTTDGDGYSLEIIDITAGLDQWRLGSAWRPSAQSGGTPGAASLLAGDVNGDLRVDLVDAAIVQRSLGVTNGATRGQSDLNGDGAVNRADAAIVARDFGRSLSTPPGAAAAVVVSARACLSASSVASRSTRLGATSIRRSPVGTADFVFDNALTDATLSELRGARVLRRHPTHRRR